MAQTDVQKDRCRNCGGRQAPCRTSCKRHHSWAAEVCARSHNGPAGRLCAPDEVRTHLFFYTFGQFISLNDATERQPLTSRGSFPGDRPCIHVNDFSETGAQHPTGMGIASGWRRRARASRFRAWPRRTSSRGSRADRRSARHRLRPRSGPARACCARRRRGCRPSRSRAPSGSS